ncbi:MAG: hypothetical protein R8P61_32380 [Bacteroidia bacterium]|nr:hypothetical protein [Bacteroidia bacterium]
MFRKLFFIGFFMCAYLAQAQQILIDQPVRAGEVTFFPDIKDPNTYYYLSDKASLSYREDGTPEFSFFRYVEGDKSKNSSVQSIREGTGGGIVHMIVELSVPEDVLDDGKAALKAINPAATVKGPAIYTSGKFALVSSFVAADGELSSQVVGVGTAPILDGHKAAISIQLTKQGAKILWESFKTPTPDMSFSFEMTLDGYLSPIEAKVEANFDQIYKHKAFDVAVATPVLQAEVTGAFTDMIKNGAIKISGAEADEKMDRLIELVIKKLTDMMMEPLSSSSNNMEQLMKKQSSLDRASMMMNQNRFGPYAPVPYGGHNSFGYGGGYNQQYGYYNPAPMGQTPQEETPLASATPAASSETGTSESTSSSAASTKNDDSPAANTSGGSAQNSSSSGVSANNDAKSATNTSTGTTQNTSNSGASAKPSSNKEDAISKIRQKPLPTPPKKEVSSTPPKKPVPNPPATTRPRSGAVTANTPGAKPNNTTASSNTPARPRSGAVTANTPGAKPNNTANSNNAPARPRSNANASSNPVNTNAGQTATKDGSTPDANKTKGKKSKKSTKTRTERTPKTSKAGKSGALRTKPPISIAAAFHMKEVKMSGKFEVSFNKMMKSSKTFSFAENVGNVKCKSCFHEVNLDEVMFFKQRDIRAFMDGLNSDDFENYINYVTVVLRKKHQNGKTSAQEIIVDRSRFNEKGNNFTLSYGVNGDDNYDNWLKYEYEVQWNFFGDNMVTEPKVASYFNGITLSPPYRRRVIQLEADPTFLKEQGVRLVNVKIFYKLGDQEYTKVETLNPSSGVFTLPVEYISPEQEYSYDYEINWRLRGGKVVNSGRKSSESSVLFVDELPE